MNQYELTYILSSLTEKEDAQALAGKIDEMIKGLGGQIKKEEFGDKKRLAYEIKKQSYGFYVILEIEIDPEKLEELQRELRLNRDVLRHLIIAVDEKALAEAAKAKQRQARPKAPASSTAAAPSAPAVESSDKGEKVKIEELDKKLDELLKD